MKANIAVCFAGLAGTIQCRSYENTRVEIESYPLLTKFDYQGEPGTDIFKPTRYPPPPSEIKLVAKGDLYKSSPALRGSTRFESSVTWEPINSISGQDDSSVTWKPINSLSITEEEAVTWKPINSLSITEEEAVTWKPINSLSITEEDAVTWKPINSLSFTEEDAVTWKPINSISIAEKEPTVNNMYTSGFTPQFLPIAGAIPI